MERNEIRRALFPIAAVGLSMVALITAKTGRDAVFLSSSEIEDLPLAYLFIKSGLRFQPRRALLLTGLLACFAAVSASAQDAKTSFRQNCQSCCHTIGGGRLAGPDLKGADLRMPDPVYWATKWSLGK